MWAARYTQVYGARLGKGGGELSGERSGVLKLKLAVFANRVISFFASVWIGGIIPEDLQAQKQP